MTTRLHACPGCHRHVRVDVAGCPFCKAALPLDFARSEPVPPPAGLSRDELYRFRRVGFASITAAGAVASAAALVSCGSVYGAAALGSHDDAGVDAPAPQHDAAHDAPKAHEDGTVATDASRDDARADAPCNFATFVLDLIDTQTTATALPSTDLGQSCTDDEKQSEFATLFP